MSLTETSAIVELMERVIQVTPGDSVGYLPYQGLLTRGRRPFPQMDRHSCNRGDQRALAP
jgi:hypothetical protein